MSTSAVSSASLNQQLQSFFQTRNSDVQQLEKHLVRATWPTLRLPTTTLLHWASRSFCQRQLLPRAAARAGFRSHRASSASGRLGWGAASLCGAQSHRQGCGETPPSTAGGLTPPSTVGGPSSTPEIVLNLSNSGSTSPEQITLNIANSGSGGEQVSLSVGNQGSAAQQVTFNLGSNSNEQIVINLLDASSIASSVASTTGSTGGLSVSA